MDLDREKKSFYIYTVEVIDGSESGRMGATAEINKGKPNKGKRKKRGKHKKINTTNLKRLTSPFGQIYSQIQYFCSTGSCGKYY